MKKCAEQKKRADRQKNGCRATSYYPVRGVQCAAGGIFLCILQISEEGFFGIEAIP